MSEHTEDEHTEPRRKNPVGGMSEEDMLQHLRGADVNFLDYFDAWIDKSLRDGTLTLYTAAQYREAIAARTAELGAVPHIREHIAALKLKPGDVLALIAPSESAVLMRQLSEGTQRLLEYWNITGVAIVVYPPGTEVRVLEGAGTEVSDKIREYVDAKVREAVTAPEQAEDKAAEQPQVQLWIRDKPDDGGFLGGYTPAQRRAIAAEASRRQMRQ